METRLKIKEARKHQTFSRETRLKMGKAHYKPILQYTKENIFIKEWSSIKQASAALSLSASCLSRCAKHRKGFCTAGGFKWEYKN
jgi:hypothetical protein